jgi:hypothetical protein
LYLETLPFIFFSLISYYNYARAATAVCAATIAAATSGISTTIATVSSMTVVISCRLSFV